MGVPCKNNSQGQEEPLQVRNEEGVIWVTRVMEMMNPLDHDNFVKQEISFLQEP